MQKKSQKRSLLDRLQESTNVGGIVSEKFFNPEFKEIMDQLRDTDNAFRSVLVGKNLGDTGIINVSLNGVSFKQSLDDAKKLFDKKEYLECVSYLKDFYNTIKNAILILQGFKVDLNKVHETFLFKNLDEETLKKLKQSNI